MSMKWDIADDVVAYYPITPEPKAKPKRGRVAMIAAAAALTTAVTVGGVAFASHPSAVRMVSYGSSKSVALSEGFKFVRPRGIRQNDRDELADVQVGMSTRRLGEFHSKLFVKDSEPAEELVGDYSFL